MEHLKEEDFAAFGEDYQWWFYYGGPIDWGYVKMHGTPYEWHRTPYPHNGSPIIGDIESIEEDENGLTVKYTLNEEGRKLYGAVSTPERRDT